MLLLLLCWEAAAWGIREISPYAETILPPIETILLKSLPGFGLLWIGSDGTAGSASYSLALLVLAKHSVATIGRVLLGSASGILFGVAIGLAMGWNLAVRQFAWPSIQVTRQIPSLALLPLFMLWFGGREVGTWVYISWAIFIMMVVYTVEAIRNVSPAVQDYARTLGASRMQVYRTVVLPAIVPSLIGGIRVCLGISWAIALAAEFLGAQVGLGRMLIMSQMFYDTGRMIIIIILFVIYGVVLNAAVVRFSYYLTRWVP